MSSSLSIKQNSSQIHSVVQKLVVWSILVISAYHFSSKRKEMVIRAIWCGIVQVTDEEEKVGHTGVAPFPWKSVNDCMPSTYTGNVEQLRIPILVEQH